MLSKMFHLPPSFASIKYTEFYVQNTPNIEIYRVTFLFICETLLSVLPHNNTSLHYLGALFIHLKKEMFLFIFYYYYVQVVLEIKNHNLILLTSYYNLVFCFFCEFLPKIVKN